jgi:hypothetical protein
MPSYPNLQPGSAKTWLNSAGTYAITLTSLANAALREGGKGDFYDATMGYPELLEILFETAVGVAATDGNVIELWVGESDSATAGTNNPGGLSGADATVTNGAQLRRQLNYAGGLSLSNATGTSVQRVRLLYHPTQRYVVPAVYNNSGQALSGTAANHKITVTPFYRVVN